MVNTRKRAQAKTELTAPAVAVKPPAVKPPTQGCSPSTKTMTPKQGTPSQTATESPPPVTETANSPTLKAMKADAQVSPAKAAKSKTKIVLSDSDSTSSSSDSDSGSDSASDSDDSEVQIVEPKATETERDDSDDSHTLNSDDDVISEDDDDNDSIIVEDSDDESPSSSSDDESSSSSSDEEHSIQSHKPKRVKSAKKDSKEKKDSKTKKHSKMHSKKKPKDKKEKSKKSVKQVSDKPSAVRTGIAQVMNARPMEDTSKEKSKKSGNKDVTEKNGKRDDVKDQKLPHGFKDAKSLRKKSLLVIAVGLPTRELPPGTIVIFSVNDNTLFAVNSSTGGQLEKGFFYYCNFDEYACMTIARKVKVPDTIDNLPFLHKPFLHPLSHNKESMLAGINFIGIIDNVDSIHQTRTIRGETELKELTVTGIDEHKGYFRVIVTLWGSQISQPLAMGDICIFVNLKQYVYKGIMRFNAGDACAITCVNKCKSAKKYKSKVGKVLTDCGANLELPEGLEEF